MPVCKNCGAEIDSQAKVCGNCGAVVEMVDTVDQVETVETVENVETEGTKESLDIEETVEPAETEEVSEGTPAGLFTDNENKKSAFAVKPSKNVIIAIAAAIIVILASIIPVRNYIIRKDPVKRTLYGINKLSKADAVNATSTLKLQMTSVPEDAQSKVIAKIIESFSIKLDVKSNRKTGEVSENVQLVYKDQPFIKSNLYMNKQGMVISAPDLYNKNMFVKFDELNELTGEANKNTQFDIEKYKKILDFSTSKAYKPVAKDYGQLLKENFKGSFVDGEKVKLEVMDGGTSKFISTGTVNFTTNSGVIIDFLDKFIEKAAKDSNVKTLVKDKMLELFDLIEKNNDYEKFNLSKEEIDTIKKDFDKNYDEAMSNLLNEKNFEEVKKTLNMNVRSNLRFDSSNNLRGSLTEITASVNQGEAVGFKIVSDQVINSLSGKVIVDKMDFSGVNLAKISPDEQADMNQQLQQNLLNSIDKLGLTSLLMGF